MLAIAVHDCGGGSGYGGSTLTPVDPPSAAPPMLTPVASIPLSGSAASGLAEAAGWLWVTHFQASVLSQVDPDTDAEVARVEVGPNAGSVTAIGPQLWIGQYADRPQDSRLTRVDPLTAVVTGHVQSPNLCCEVAGAAGRVWAVDPRGALLSIDPARGRVVGSTSVALDPNVHVGLVGDERALWLSSDTSPLLKIDPTSARVIASFDVGGGIPMAIAHDLVWGASPHQVWAVDPASNEIRVRLPLENTIETLNLAVSGDALWVGARRPGYVGVVLRFDLASQRLTGEAAVSLPGRLLAAFGSVWIVDWDTNRLLRFD